MDRVKEYYTKVHGKLFASKKCDFPDCEKDCYTDQDGHQYEYCSRTHGKWHAEMKQQQQQAYYAAKYMSKPSPPTTGPIRFYNSDEPYYEFTNFYKVMIKVDGVLWPTTEHYFQAQKFVGTPYVEHICRLSRAREAFEFARIPGVSHWRRNNWENVKIDIMKKALLAKFSQHPYLCRLLLGTRKRKLIEHSPHDSFWGDGGDGSGRNELGKLLMDIRTELQKNRECEDSSVDDECDRHKRKPDSSKSPDNEPLSPSPPSSEYSTSPETNHTSERSTATDGSNRTDGNSVNQESPMDTSDGTTPPHPTGEAANESMDYNAIHIQPPKILVQHVQPPASDPLPLQPRVGAECQQFNSSALRETAPPIERPKCNPNSSLNDLSLDLGSNTASIDGSVTEGDSKPLLPK